LKVKEEMRGIALSTVNLNIGWIYVANVPVTLSKRKYPNYSGRGVPEAVWTLRKIEKSLDDA
jgi:hypothetical protein